MKKAKFTLIDAFIILVVIAVLAVAVLKFAPSGGAGGKGAAEFTILVTDVKKEVANMPKIGDEVRLSAAEPAYGNIIDVTVEPHEESKFVAELGEYVTDEVDGKFDVIVKVESEADISDSAIINNNVPIRVGSPMLVNSKGYAMSGFVIDVRER